MGERRYGAENRMDAPEREPAVTLAIHRDPPPPRGQGPDGDDARRVFLDERSRSPAMERKPEAMLAGKKVTLKKISDPQKCSLPRVSEYIVPVHFGPQ